MLPTEERSKKDLQTDRILPVTRLVAGLVVPVLVLAFLILYIFPDTTADRFAWEINPHMTAMYMGAGYLGGAWLFFNVLIGKKWHQAAPGFLPVTTFTWFMLVVTVLHWERFDPGHLPFQLWLLLYVATPFLVPMLWWFNRQPYIQEPGDPAVPLLARAGLTLLGVGLFLTALAGMIRPEILISIWPWNLSLLTARIMSGWFALLGVGGLVIGREQYWSSWKTGLESIGCWHALVLLAALLNPGDFHQGLMNWYLITVVLVLVGMLALYLRMERLKSRVMGRHDASS